MKKFFKEVLYWSPYIPILGVLSLIIFMSQAGDNILCVDKSKHHTWSMYLHMLAIILLTILIAI